MEEDVLSALVNLGCNRAAAEGMLRRALGYDPNNKTAHYLLAQLLQQLGRAEEAKKEFEIAERLQATVDR